MNVSLLEAEGHAHGDKSTPGIEQTDLTTLVKHRERTQASTSLGEVYQQFQTDQQDYCAVMESNRVVGLCSRGHIGFLMGHRYGFSIYSRDPVREHMVENPLMLRRGTAVRQVLETALSRQGKAFNEDLILLGAEDDYLGIIPVPTLVQLQSALVEERFRVQESMHRRLLAVSRQAGMAEVATGVLHNVGNTLNSVNVSATVAMEMVRNSKIKGLEKAAAVLEEKRAELGDYLSNDPKGKLLPEFLIRLASRLRTEQADQLRELESLLKHIGHIKSVITMQQRYAKVSGILELVSVREMVEDSLEMNADALTRHGVVLERHFEEVPTVVADKHKVLQILVNLIRNAKYAVDHGPGPEKKVSVSIRAGPHHCVQIHVQDNGVGIAPENLNRVFGHGFTTKKDGHGFGLHTSALAAKEMGGTLRAHSEGLGRGATFTLELPVAHQSAPL
ncbi:MAG: sensor histidine kinase [Limisphaerales bacterium]